MVTAAVRTPEMQRAAGSAEPHLKIRPPRRWAALQLRDVWEYRNLLMALAGRDLKLRYKQTALGATWVVLQPLLGAGIFSIVFGSVARLPSGGIPYFVFSYAGLLGWNIFSDTLSKTSGCLIGSAHLIRKIFFPRLVLPLSSVPSTLTDFTVAFAMMIVLMLAYHLQFHVWILLLPVWAAMILMTALGVGLIAAAFIVSYRDIQYIVPVFSQMLLYGSPVAYSLSFALTRVPARLRWVYFLNPLSAPLEAFRASLLGTEWPSPLLLCYSACMAVIVMVLGVYCFKHMERKFVDVI